jgi:hypothetical protein
MTYLEFFGSAEEPPLYFCNKEEVSSKMSCSRQLLACPNSTDARNGLKSSATYNQHPPPPRLRKFVLGVFVI